MSNREELFKQAAAQREKEKKDEAARRSGGGYTREYEDIAYLALAEDSDKVFRMLGAPPTMRTNEFDPKIVLYSYVRSDTGSNSRIIWPSKEDNATWILWKIFDLVLKHKWDNTKNERIYTYKDSHPDIFMRVFKNGRPDVKFEGGWKPKEVVMANVIDRHDLEWHKENKHTKLLSKKASKMDGDSWWFEPGIPYYTFKIIWDDVVEYNGDWENYDMALRKISDNPFYKAFHGINDLKKIQESSRSFIYDGPLTDEEKLYARYDIDKLFKVTSYQKIHRSLGVFIQQVDAAFKTSFYKELESLVEKEKLEYDQNNPTKEDVEENSPSPEEQATEPAVAASTSPPKRAAAALRKPLSEQKKIATVNWEGLADGTFNGMVYEGVPKMTEEEKAMVVSVNEDGSFKYVDEYEGNVLQLFEFEQSGFLSPQEFHVDPLSGIEFADA